MNPLAILAGMAAAFFVNGLLGKDDKKKTLAKVVPIDDNPPEPTEEPKPNEQIDSEIIGDNDNSGNHPEVVDADD